MRTIPVETGNGTPQLIILLIELSNQNKTEVVSGFTILDTPVLIRTLKLINIGPG
jgi:hypothetical protein